MKLFLAIIFSAFLLISAATNAVRLSDPVQTDENSETFGAVIDPLPTTVTISQLLDTPETYKNKQFSVDAEVNKVCQKKGCFFIAQQGDQLIRVAFKDYSFFVPTDINGRAVTLVGELTAQQISPKQAAHLNKDLGEDGSIQTGLVYEIVATSVRIPIKK